MRLTDCFIELIAYALYFKKNAGVHQPSFEQVRADVLRHISKSDDCLGKSGFSQNDAEFAKFAVFAWVDEMMMNSSWHEKDRWQIEKLQKTYLGTDDAGNIFFDHLNSFGIHQRDVREIYYLCLCMGFEGKYNKKEDQPFLGGLKMQNLNALVGSSTALERSLFPEAYPAESPGHAPRMTKRGLPPLMPFLLCLGIPFGLYWILFFIFRFSLDNIGQSIGMG